MRGGAPRILCLGVPATLNHDIVRGCQEPAFVFTGRQAQRSGTHKRRIALYPAPFTSWRAKMTSSVPFKKSWICPHVRVSLFCMGVYILPQNTDLAHSSFMIILYWNQAQFHDHLVFGQF
jgi:hypothetical protein